MMKQVIKHLAVASSLLLAGMILLSFTQKKPGNPQTFPYKEAGLTDRQAAAHLLDRFSYGATPGQVDDVVKVGIENWFAQQLQADRADTHLDAMLDDYSSLQMSNAEIIERFPKNARLLRMAIRDGAIRKEDVDRKSKETKKALAEYMRTHNYRAPRELYAELIAQKILRAAYSENQLHEVLNAFWFNHFNVSLTDNDCARFITAYERDAIRPNALGKFETMLLATAKSPAMLLYLDNFKSSASSADKMNHSRQQATGNQQSKNPQGLNENYAREIMELHTLGVDGGYTQQDVTEAARIFTGWTVNPALNEYKRQMPAKNANARNLSSRGFVIDGDFLFAANRHDKDEKVVLGATFPGDGGYQEGVKLIHMLAQHSSTARFIATKLAVRFVHDTPPKTLVDKMAKTFLESEGDIKQVLTSMVVSPEFWSKEAIREKIKSPFELAISAVRSLNAEVTKPYALYTWISKMGEKVYAYQAPTGFPDRSQYWINTGSLLTRMNFGLAIASQRIPAIKVDLPRLHQHREPESAEEALAIYSRYLLPERDLDETIKRLTPLLNDPAFSNKVDSAANKATRSAEEVESRENIPMTALAQVVGIVIGSPEFQRR